MCLRHLAMCMQFTFLSILLQTRSTLSRIMVWPNRKYLYDVTDDVICVSDYVVRVGLTRHHNAS